MVRSVPAFASIFDAAASDYDGRVSFGTCNVDTNPKSAGLLQIQSVPTLVVFGTDGSELRRVAGVLPRRQLDAIIEQVAPPPPAHELFDPLTEAAWDQHPASGVRDTFTRRSGRGT